MTSVVLEFQRDALDWSIRVSDLLRKALVVVRKLSLEEFEQWGVQELSGYDKAEVVPRYRNAHGQARTWNPLRGRIPVVFESASEAEAISKRDYGQSLAELENLAQPEHCTCLTHQQRLSSSFPIPTEVSLFVPSTVIIRIVDTVRTRVLNWALELEEHGILGEGMSFTAGENKNAGQLSRNSTNFYGPVESPLIQPAGHQALQLNLRALDVNAIRSFVELLPDTVFVRPDGRGVARDFKIAVADPADVPLLVAKVGRNRPCPCGSGRKYKRCHGC